VLRPIEKKGKIMLPTTIDVFRSSLKADPTVSPADRARVLAFIRNGGSPVIVPPPLPNNCPRLLRRAEVARRLSVCLRTVDNLPLRKVKLPGRKRGAGFLETDVNALIEQAA
jgi:hypothetical protein